MPHMGYRDLGASDFPTWGEWIGAVNAAIEYCKALPAHRVREWRFKCRASALPSFHPYWKMAGHRDTMRQGQRHRDNLLACRKDASMIRVLYNANTNLKQLESRVAAMHRRRQDWAKVITSAR
jgi:hypothetical protein